MSGIFGGGTSRASRENVENTREENTRREGIIREQGELARQDILGTIAASIDPQINAFQAGNFAAQEALLAGLPQMQNALLGLPTDTSALQAQRFNVDTSFVPTAQPQQQAQAPAQNPLLDLARYGFNFGGR